MTDHAPETFIIEETENGDPLCAKVGKFDVVIHDGSGLLVWNPTDAMNARRLIHLFGSRIRYCEGPMGWMTYNGSRWVIGAARRVSYFVLVTGLAIGQVGCKLPDKEQKEFTQKISQVLQTEYRIRGCMKVAECEPEVNITPGDLDADPFAFNVLNGTLDLRTGKLRPHSAADLITHLAPVTFDPEARCPLFDTFFSQVTCGDTNLAGYLLRVLGMSMTGDITEQCLWIFHGPGANGKDSLIDALANVMGDYQSLAAPELLVAKRWSSHPTEVADLHGRRLVVSSETEKDQELRVSFVKQATGGARLKARFMRGDFFEFPRTHKTILVTNNPPVISEITRAVWRRIKLVPFFYTVPDDELDKDLGTKLRTEAPGILNRLIQGCLDWQQNGLREASAVERATAVYQQESDLFSRFAQDVELDFGTTSQYRVAAKFLNQKRARWNNETGLLLTQVDLSICLKNRGCTPYKNSEGRAWQGVRLPHVDLGG